MAAPALVVEIGMAYGVSSLSILSALEKNGNAIAVARRLDHWAYFPTETSRAAFIEGVQRLGFEVGKTSELEGQNNSYCVEIFRVDVPAYWAIDEVTHPLLELAKELGGIYDGWEASSAPQQ